MTYWQSLTTFGRVAFLWALVVAAGVVLAAWNEWRQS